MSLPTAGDEPTSRRRKALLSLASFAIPLAIALVAMPILYRRMGASAFGILSIALLTPALALSFDLGMSSAAVRRIADELQSRSRTVGSTIAGYALALSAAGVAVGGAIALAAPVLASALGFEQAIGAERATALLRLCALWAAVALIFTWPGLVLRAQQRFAAITALQTIATIALWATLLTLSARDSSIFTMVAAALLITAVMAIITVSMALSGLPSGTHFKPSLRAVRADARFSFGLWMLQLSNVLAFQLDRAIVAALASPATAGTYALCVGLANKTLFAIASLTSFAFPEVASLRSEGRHADVASLLQMLQRVAIVLMAAILVPAVMLSGPFLSLWLGPALQPDTTPLLQLLWVGYAAAAIGAPATHVITGTGTSRLAATFAWITAITLLGTMALLVPSYGLIGAGISNMIAMSTALIFLWLVRKELNVRASNSERLWTGLMIAMLAQVLFLIVVASHVTSWGMFVVVGTASVLLFVAVRAATHTITDEERRLIHSSAAWLRTMRTSGGPPQR